MQQLSHGNPFFEAPILQLLHFQRQLETRQRVTENRPCLHATAAALGGSTLGVCVCNLLLRAAAAAPRRFHFIITELTVHQSRSRIYDSAMALSSSVWPILLPVFVYGDCMARSYTPASNECSGTQLIRGVSTHFWPYWASKLILNDLNSNLQ